MTGRGRGKKESFLFSPPPPPSTFFFCFRSNFRAITRLETLATQAKMKSKPRWTIDTSGPLWLVIHVVQNAILLSNKRNVRRQTKEITILR